MEVPGLGRAVGLGGGGGIGRGRGRGARQQQRDEGRQDEGAWDLHGTEMDAGPEPYQAGVTA